MLKYTVSGIINVEKNGFLLILIRLFEYVSNFKERCLHCIIVGILSFDNAIESEVFEKVCHICDVFWHLVQIMTVRFGFVLGVSHAIIVLDSDQPGHANSGYEVIFVRHLLLT